MKPRNTIGLIAICLSTWILPEHSIAQLPKELSDYLCKRFTGFQMDSQYRPVKYLEKLFPVGVSYEDARRIDSLNIYGDTIYFLQSDFNDFISLYSVNQKEADEMMAAIQMFAKKGKAGKLACTPQNPGSRPVDLSISFSQPVFTKDRTMCLMKYDIASIGDTSSDAYRQRETLLLKYEEGKWVDQEVLTLRHSELRD